MLAYANSYQPWNSALPTLILIQNCKTRYDVHQIHARMITTGYINNTSLTTRIILKFISSPQRPLVEFARYVFFTRRSFRILTRKRADPFLWNAVIKSYSHGSDPKQAFFVFCMMLEKWVCPDKFSFSLVLKACARVGLVKEGKQIHGLLKKLNLGSNLFLLNCLIACYLKCEDIGSARQMFDRMSMRDSISYNSMIDGYVNCGMIELARQLFDSMPMEKRNSISWNSMIRGCAQSTDGLKVAIDLFERMPERDLISWNTMINGCVKCGKMEEAIDLFRRMPKRDSISWSNMIDGYAKLGRVDVARSLFDEMPEKDVVAFNVMMAGYAQNGYFIEALTIYNLIQNESNFSPDEATLLIVLSAIAQLGHVEKGVTIHRYLTENGFSLRGKLGVALIDVYSKCGSVENAVLIFDSIAEKSIDHWNAMINGVAIHGLGQLAFDFLMQMVKLCIKPNDITYIGVLNACGHSGLVKEGIISFELMRRVHKVVPKLQHYGCMVDILGRAGLVEEALKFIENMPIEPNDVIWRSLLGACQNHEKYAIGKTIGKHLTMVESCDPSPYVLLSNIYASLNMWNSVRKIRKVMKERNLTKIPGCSSIELDGIVHEFFVEDKSHPRVMEIYSILDGFRTSDSHVVTCNLAVSCK